MADATTTDPKRVSIPRFASDYPERAETLEQTRLPFYCCNCHRKQETTYLTPNIGPFCDDCFAEVKAALLSASQPSAPVDPCGSLDLLLGPVEKRLARGQYRTLPPETIEGDIAALVKSVTALHVERDRLKAEKENDAWHRGWKVAVAERDEARDLQRRAEAEAARLRAALETLKALIEKWQKEADEYASDSAYNAAIHCANELEHALKAALDSSGTVPGKTGGA